MKTTLIPARGTVEFRVYSLRDDDHPDNPDILIDGPDRWSRPVAGLVGQYRAIHDDDSSHPRPLPYEPVVADEIGLLHPVSDYLQWVMGDLQWDHCTHFYWPHIDGPVSDAPRISDLSKIRPLSAAD